MVLTRVASYMLRSVLSQFRFALAIFYSKLLGIFMPFHLPNTFHGIYVSFIPGFVQLFPDLKEPILT